MTTRAATNTGSYPDRCRAWCRAAILLVALPACSTIGLGRSERAWAEVEPPIAYEISLDNRNIVILDVRAAEEFHGPLGHIPGAISVPLGVLRERLPELLAYRRETVVVYGDVESDAVDGVRSLVTAGFQNVILIRGGVRAWIERGYETVSAP